MSGAGAAVVKPLEVVEREDGAAALLNPVRRAMLERLREPGSATSLAGPLGLTRQQANYHLKELERVGLVRAAGGRKKGGFTERLVVATASHYLISPAALGALGGTPEAAQDRFSWAALASIAASALRDLGVLRRRADEAGQRLATFSMQTELAVGSPAALRAFAEELAEATARVVAKHHDEGAKEGRRFTVFVGSYPTITRGDGAAGD